jgi:RNA polymerase sigma-70 factor, ECF subfamily
MSAQVPAQRSSDDPGAPAEATRDETAFRELVEAHRAELHAHCYRMLASLYDADDALQETLLRAWRGLPGFRGQSSLRTWLYRIATNVCLDAIARRPKRVLPVDYGPAGTAPDPDDRPVDNVWVEPYPDRELGVADAAAGPEARYEQREALEIAFVAALQHLPPRQRAALVLRDVLAFSAKETAQALHTTVPSVNGALQRARTTVARNAPERSQQATLRTLGDRRIRAVVEQFADAFERGDVAAILALLTADAKFEMPPYPQWCEGRDQVGESWLMPGGDPPRLRYVSTRANGQLALGCYLIDAETGWCSAIALDVLTLRGGLISEVTAFRTPAVFPRFGLPDRLPPGSVSDL